MAPWTDAPYAKRYYQWRKKRKRQIREALFSALGKFCKLCGATEKLEFDCIQPQGDKHHKMSAYCRALFYKRQHEAGNIQVLCEKCNARKGDS